MKEKYHKTVCKVCGVSISATKNKRAGYHRTTCEEHTPKMYGQ